MSSRTRPSWPDRALSLTTRWAARQALWVVLSALLIATGCWSYASGLRIEGSFVALLPSASPTAARFSETLERKAGGSSTLIVLVRSAEPKKSRAYVDQLAQRLARLPPSLVRSVETGPGASREFFLSNKWLFATEADLALLKCRIEREHEKRQPGYLDLEDPCEETVSTELREDEVSLPRPTPDDAREKEPSSQAAKPRGSGGSELQRFDQEIEDQLRVIDRYPSGYFQNEDGSLFSVLIRAPSAGMGEFSSDELFARVKTEASTLLPDFADLEVGYAGDIPNAIEQRNALISDMATISILAVALILGSIVVYFRSFVALLQIGFCVTVGCGFAFAIAMAAYGRLNTATSFLGAIIFGNGINYAIVYLARYRELRTLGKEREAALIEAALSTRKGTWLAALAAGGAYGALLFTSFRGFSEFGLVGGSGMLLCWGSTFVVLPASIALLESWQRTSGVQVAATLPVPLRPVGRFAVAHHRAILVFGVLLTAAAAYPLGDYLRDPWEYNFSRLGSQASKKKGAGKWSRGANKVFQSRGSPMLMMGDDMSEVLDLRRQLLERDQRISGGATIERVETIYDRLGGGPGAVAAKLQLLSDIREKIDEIAPRLKGEDLAIAKKWRPPATLRPLQPEDLPDLVRSQFTEKDGTVGTPIYIYLNRGMSQSRGENLLRISEIFEGVKTSDNEVAPNASRSTVFAAMIRAMERDGPLATFIAFLAVVLVTVVVTRSLRSTLSILGALLCGVILTVGGAAWLDVRLNFLNFVALPLTFGIGVEYAINLFERIRVSGGVEDGVASAGGPVALCSLTTILGYGALIFADNMALQSFGRYAMAGELACIVTALLILPAALTRWPPKTNRPAPL